MSDDMPLDDFMSHTEQVAVSHHEIWQAYVKAGFNEEQALDMLKVMIAVSLRGGGE